MTPTLTDLGVLLICQWSRFFWRVDDVDPIKKFWTLVLSTRAEHIPGERYACWGWNVEIFESTEKQKYIKNFKHRDHDSRMTASSSTWSWLGKQSWSSIWSHHGTDQLMIWSKIRWKFRLATSSWCGAEIQIGATSTTTTWTRTTSPVGLWKGQAPHNLVSSPYVSFNLRLKEMCRPFL